MAQLLASIEVVHPFPTAGLSVSVPPEASIAIIAPPVGGLILRMLLMKQLFGGGSSGGSDDDSRGTIASLGIVLGLMAVTAGLFAILPDGIVFVGICVTALVLAARRR